MLLVSHAGPMCGFIVDSLTVILMAGDGPSRFGEGAGGAEGRFPLVETQDGRLLPSLCLGDLAARISHA